MTAEERALIAKREKLANEIEKYLSEKRGTAFYPIQLVEHYEGEQGFNEAMIISAIWRLIDDHRVKFDNQLMVAAR